MATTAAASKEVMKKALKKMGRHRRVGRLNYPKRIPKGEPIKKWKIMRGDEVQVMRGKEKGKKGVVKMVKRDKNKVIVEGLNLITKNNSGTFVSKEKGIHYSNIGLLDPILKSVCRVKWAYQGDRKVRVSKKNGEVIPRPLQTFKKFKEYKDGPLDTPIEATFKKTYIPSY